MDWDRLGQTGNGETARARAVAPPAVVSNEESSNLTLRVPSPATERNRPWAGLCREQTRDDRKAVIVIQN